MIVAHIEALHRDIGLGYRELCASEGIDYTAFLRWRERDACGERTVNRPGPRKVEAPDLDALRAEVHALNHGRKRSAGVGELYEKRKDEISRRDLGKIVREERKRLHNEATKRRVRWNVPGLVWATDDTEFHPDKRYPKAYLHNVQDLGSRFKFDPLVGHHLASGADVARHLELLFSEHPPPLFLKRDNHRNLNNQAIEAVLQDAFVVPVNSPFRYPQYNGGIENAQGQIKSRINAHPETPGSFLAIQAQLDIQAINHRRTPCIGNRTPCELYRRGEAEARNYTRRQRKETYDWIKEKTLELVRQERYNSNTAWRKSVETWLLEHGIISVSKT